MNKLLKFYLSHFSSSICFNRGKTEVNEEAILGMASNVSVQDEALLEIGQLISDILTGGEEENA